MDASNEFSNSVKTATCYFTTHEDDKRVVAVYSKRLKEYYINSVENSKIFMKLSHIKIKQSIENIKIFVFDFDMTLTSEHSGGIFRDKIIDDKQINGLEYDYFSNEQYLQVLLLFTKIKNDPENLIYIVSRGVSSKIKKNLLNTHPELLEFIECIYGSLDYEHVNSESFDSCYWENKKYIFLNKIKNMFSEFDSVLYFFDDTKQNIKYVNNKNTEDIKGFIVEHDTEHKTNISVVVENALYSD
jgi:hypothetical protein